MTTRADLFAAYGDDFPALLAAWPNLDPTGYRVWSEQAEHRQIKAEYARWRSRQTADIAKTRRTESAPPLFDAPPAKVETVKVRAIIAHEGGDSHLMELAGEDGAKKLREAALRDLGPAETTTARCRRMIDLADQILAESERLGRPVSVAEVIGMAA